MPKAVAATMGIRKEPDTAEEQVVELEPAGIGPRDRPVADHTQAVRLADRKLVAVQLEASTGKEPTHREAVAVDTASFTASSPFS